MYLYPLCRFLREHMDAFEVAFYFLCAIVSALVIVHMYKGCIELRMAAAEVAEDECSDPLAVDSAHASQV